MRARSTGGALWACTPTYTPTTTRAGFRCALLVSGPAPCCLQGACLGPSVLVAQTPCTSVALLLVNPDRKTYHLHAVQSVYSKPSTAGDPAPLTADSAAPFPLEPETQLLAVFLRVHRYWTYPFYSEWKNRNVDHGTAQPESLLLPPPRGGGTQPADATCAPRHR